MYTSSLFLIPPIHTEPFSNQFRTRRKPLFDARVADSRETDLSEVLKEKQIILYSQHLPKKTIIQLFNYSYGTKNRKKFLKYGENHVFVWKLSHFYVFFFCCLPRSRTKDHQTRSPFLELQAIYLSLELAASLLSRGT